MKVFALDAAPGALGWGPLTAATAVVVLLAWVAAVRKKSNQRKRCEGSTLWTPPSTLPVVGNTFDLVQNASRINDWMTEQCHASGGQPVLLSVAGQKPTIIMSTPEHYDEIARTRFAVFGKGPINHDLLSGIMGDSILTVDGDEWKFHRRIMVGLFSQSSLRGPMTQTIQKHARSFKNCTDSLLTPSARSRSASTCASCRVTSAPSLKKRSALFSTV